MKCIFIINGDVMIKVNYDNNTGRVIGFDLDKEPYILITEEERKQPIKNKYGYYVVKDNKFTIEYRTPSDEEVENDKISEINSKIRDLKLKLSNTDYKAIKYAEGFISEDDYKSIKQERQGYRDRINELEQELIKENNK